MVETEGIPILSLFSGGGFLDLGFLNEGFQVKEALEINDKFIYGYNSSMSRYATLTNNPYWKEKIVSHIRIDNSSDLSKRKTLLEVSKKNVGITGIIGGPPCQDYSIGGKNLGIDGDRGKLILSYFSLVKRIKPEFLFFENVEGLYRTKIHKENFMLLINSLNKIGYKLWYQVVNPIDYGFPQDRPRIIVVGFKKKIIREISKLGYTDNSGNVTDYNDRAIFNFPKRKLINPKLIGWPKQWEFGSDVKMEEIEGIPNEFSSLFIKNALEGLSLDSPNQDECFIPRSDKFNIINEGDTGRKSFKRLHRFRFSPTVAYGNNEVHLHPTEPRRLTIREALRLQTVPDQYILPKELTLTTKFKMISNGVPTKIAELVAKEIKRTLSLY